MSPARQWHWLNIRTFKSHSWSVQEDIAIQSGFVCVCVCLSEMATCEIPCYIHYIVCPVPVHSHSCVMFRQCDILVCCLSPVHSITSSVHRTSFQYRCTQNQFSWHINTEPLYSTAVHKTSLQYRCTPNQFAIHMFTEPVCTIAVHKASLLYRCTKIIYQFINSLLEQLLRTFEVLV